MHSGYCHSPLCPLSFPFIPVPSPIISILTFLSFYFALTITRFPHWDHGLATFCCSLASWAAGTPLKTMDAPLLEPTRCCGSVWRSLAMSFPWICCWLPTRPVRGPVLLHWPVSVGPFSEHWKTYSPIRSTTGMMGARFVILYIHLCPWRVSDLPSLPCNYSHCHLPMIFP